MTRITISAVLVGACNVFIGAQIAPQTQSADSLPAVLTAAKTARLVLDSALVSYEAIGKQRLSVWLGTRAAARASLAYRHESAARISWTQGAATRVELLAAKTVVGMFSGNFSSASDRDLVDAVPLPYFPGRDHLWSGDGMVTGFVGTARAVRDSVDQRELINPLARGAESFYRYSIGDSVRMRLPNGQEIRLIELRVKARRPQWNLIVGSFWFDQASAVLVRAAYRSSLPMDVMTALRESGAGRAPPRWLRAVIGNMRVELNSVTVEYSLNELQHWLPRIQVLDGTATAGGLRLSIRIEQSFEYPQVNALRRSPGVSAVAPTAPVIGARARDSLRRAECASTGKATVVSRRYEGAVVVEGAVPCDRVLLASSPLLTTDIGTGVNASTWRQLASALDFSLQPTWGASRPVLSWGLPLTRYNRVEGLSSGADLSWTPGEGYTFGATLRASAADRRVRGEVRAMRATGKRVVGAAAYSRLTPSNDWGDAFSAGSSLQALLWGRDDFAWYRSAGVELATQPLDGNGLSVRLFGEAQRAAPTRATYRMFVPQGRPWGAPTPNADRLTALGMAARHRVFRGDDARGWRVGADTRWEAALGPYPYGRMLAELMTSRGLGGPLRGSLAVAGGAAAGDPPVQRLFYLGGGSTVRGTSPRSLIGGRMWLARADIGAQVGVIRPMIFTDLAGIASTSAQSAGERRLAGSGVSLGLFDGLLRMELGRPHGSAHPWRFEMRLDSRF